MPVYTGMRNFWLVALVFSLTVGIGIGVRHSDSPPYNPSPPVNNQPTPPPPPPEPQAEPPHITTAIPGYQNYQELVGQLHQWEREAPDWVEIGTYGRSSRGQSLYYIRIANKKKHHPQPLPKVLITAGIHGNEPWSTSTVMAYIGTLLQQYGKDEQITELLDTRDIYFIPVVSPDSYPHSRHVDGVDPNRNFPTANNPNRQSVPPIAALCQFFEKIKPNAVISGHTYGRVFLQPWGDQTRLCPNHNDFQRILKEMSRMCQYRMQRACEMYNSPIYGTEVDWYYRHGAFSIVMEFGTHQNIPSMRDTKSEFDRTFQGVLYFIKEAPLVEIKSTAEWYDYRIAA